jgi:hypothetical protein
MSRTICGKSGYLGPASLIKRKGGKLIRSPVVPRHLLRSPCKAYQIQNIMASRLTRGLTQVNRHVSTRLSARAVPRLATVSARAGLLAHRNTRNVAPWTCRVKQANPTRYAHTESASPGGQEVGILDATGYKGSTITEKHWVEQDVGVGTKSLVNIALSPC